MKRIAFIRQRFTAFGGAEKYVHSLAGLLAGQGHEVHILARKWETDNRDGLIFHPIRCGGPTFLRLRRFARQADRIVRENRFDLVHSFERTWSQDIFRAGDGCHREWLLRRARVQGKGRELLDRYNPRHRAFLDLEARLFASPRLKIILSNSQQGREEIIRHYGLSPEKIRVVYNGLDRSRFHTGLDRHREAVRRELGLDPDEPLALFVGSGFLRKGLGELIDGLARTSAKLIVVGKDHPGPFIRRAARKKVAGRVVFLGPRKDVDRLYGAADVFVLPSWYEPFSNACLEAMAAGLPVITTRETGAAEVIREGENGFTLDFPVDPEQLGRAIEKSLKMDRQSIIQTNQPLLHPFSWEQNLADTLDAYRHLLGEDL